MLLNNRECSSRDFGSTKPSYFFSSTTAVDMETNEHNTLMDVRYWFSYVYEYIQKERKQQHLHTALSTNTRTSIPIITTSSPPAAQHASLARPHMFVCVLAFAVNDNNVPPLTPVRPPTPTRRVCESLRDSSNGVTVVHPTEYSYCAQRNPDHTLGWQFFLAFTVISIS
eukprot:scaffold2696_cov17-Prasinocladus_malaysianus.AAC.1